MPMPLDELVEARAFVSKLRDRLPSSVDPAELGVRSKAPFKLLCTREALIWRTEELARNACDALERDDLAVAAILTRAISENAAIAWKLMKLFDAREKHSAQQLDDDLMRLLLGSRLSQDLPQAFQILSCLDQMDKTIPGVRACYDILSEYSHPNWRGVCGLFSYADERQLITYFGRGLTGTENIRTTVLKALLDSLGLFEYAYDRISKSLPAFIAELESL